MLLYSTIGNIIDRGSHWRRSARQGVLRNFAKLTGKHLCQSLLFNKVAGLKACNFIKKETLSQVFSCEFCKISTNIFFYRRPPVAVFVYNITNATEQKHQEKQEKLTMEINFATCTWKYLNQSLFLITLQAGLRHRCFFVNFAKFLQTPFLKNISR